MFKELFEFLVVTGILTLILLYSPIFLDCDPKSYRVNLPKKFEGPLAVNEKLNQGEKYLEGKVQWPESLALFEDNIYTGMGDGYIARITGNKVLPILRTGKKSCEGQWEESECGRPLGMRFTKDGTMYVVDASFGLLAVDVKNKKFETILSSKEQIEGLNLTLMNDLAIDENGMVYFTQSSTKWMLTQVVLNILDHDMSGRLLSYNTKTKEVKVLAKNLGFPNGVEISHDGKRLIVAETLNNQIWQYHLSGPRKDTLEPLLSDLPGEPDNIRRSKKGGYWVALAGARTEDKPTILDQLSEYPAVRKILMRLVHTTGSIMFYISDYLPYPAFKTFAYNIKVGRALVGIDKLHGMILRFNDEGKIEESLHSPDGKVAYFSEVLEHDGHLYVGSWKNSFILKVKQ